MTDPNPGDVDVSTVAHDAALLASHAASPAHPVTDAFFFCAVAIRESDDARPYLIGQSSDNLRSFDDSGQSTSRDRDCIKKLIDFIDCMWVSWDDSGQYSPSEEWHSLEGNSYRTFLRITSTYVFVLMGSFSSVDQASHHRMSRIVSFIVSEELTDASIMQQKSEYLQSLSPCGSRCKTVLRRCNTAFGMQFNEQLSRSDAIATMLAEQDKILEIMRRNIDSIICRGMSLDSDLQEKTASLESQAAQFFKQSASLSSSGASAMASSDGELEPQVERFFARRTGGLLQFRWHATFMRLALLHPRMILQSLFLLPFAAVLGLVIVPVTAIMITCTPSGVKGMFQHASGHSVTSAVWGSLLVVGAIWSFVCNIPNVLAAILVPVGLCSAFAIAQVCGERCMFLIPASRYKAKKVRWSYASNWIASFSLLLEYVQLLSIAIVVASLDIGHVLDASLIRVLTIIVRPFGAAIDVQFGVACGFCGLLLGFLCISIVLTSQPETRVARTTVERERAGNLGWLKQLIALSADTFFISVLSALFAAAESFHHELPSDSEWKSSQSLFWLRALSLVIAFAYSCASMLMVLPIQSVYPELWLPKGLDARAAPLFSLVERSLKVFLLSSLSLGPQNLSYFRSGVFIAVTICTLLAGWFVGRPGCRTVCMVLPCHVLPIFFRGSRAASAISSIPRLYSANCARVVGFLRGWVWSNGCACSLPSSSAEGVERETKSCGIN
jgi:hypothetical protein